MSHSLTVAEAAQRLGVSKVTIYRLIQSGDLESFKVRRSRRIPTASIDRFIRRHLEGGSA